MRNTLMILLMLVSLSIKAEIINAEIVVYGATPSGIAAAVAAAREGKKVIIIEPLNIAGGMMSGGLSFSDSNQMARESLGGLFEEIHLRIQAIYNKNGIRLPYDVSVKDNRKWTYEPHVAEKVFQDMLEEAGVSLVLNETLRSVKKKGTKINAIKTYSGNIYQAQVFIDASYEGDLLAAAGVSYSVGRESRNEYGESLAGATYPKDHVPVRATTENGKLLPLVNSKKMSPEGAEDHRIMTYSFRLCLSSDPNNQVPFTKPAGYDPEEFAIFSAFYKANPTVRTPIDLYPIPGLKFDGNNGIALQLSSGLVGENYKYPEAKPKKRQKIWDAHQNFTQGLLYFLQTDKSLPEAIRKQISSLGYAKDEFVNNHHFPRFFMSEKAEECMALTF